MEPFTPHWLFAVPEEGQLTRAARRIKKLCDKSPLKRLTIDCYTKSTNNHKQFKESTMTAKPKNLKRLPKADQILPPPSY